MTDSEKIKEFIGLIEGKKEYINILFCKRYKVGKESRYTFVKPDISDDAADQFLEWFLENLNSLTDKLAGHIRDPNEVERTDIPQE